MMTLPSRPPRPSAIIVNGCPRIKEALVLRLSKFPSFSLITCCHVVQATFADRWVGCGISALYPNARDQCSETCQRTSTQSAKVSERRGCPGPWSNTCFEYVLLFLSFIRSCILITCRFFSRLKARTNLTLTTRHVSYNILPLAF